LNKEREIVEAKLLTSSSDKSTDSENREENIYEEIIDALPEGIFRTGMDGKILLANEALAKILGFEDILDFSKVNSNELYVDDEERKKLLKVLLAQRKIKNYRIRLRKKRRNSNCRQGK
jgi:PAS domain S-box-containing protein